MTSTDGPAGGAVVSIIVPALNESGRIVETLSALQDARRAGHEVILADGGSDDGTPEEAAPYADRVECGPRGRSTQMNAGARVARGDTLLFLHADTLVPQEAMKAFLEEFPASGRCWGWFDVSLSGRHFLLWATAVLMNLRARLTGIATGDKAIFVRRGTFEKIGGYPEIPLMEDIAICRLLKKEGLPFCPSRKIVTSSRRWEEKGIVRTILLMWRLRLAYFFGADPEDLARAYRDPSGPKGSS